MTPKLYTIIYIKSIKKLREKDENEKRGPAENEKKGRRKILTFEKKGRTLLVTLFMFG